MRVGKRFNLQLLQGAVCSVVYTLWCCRVEVEVRIGSRVVISGRLAINVRNSTHQRSAVMVVCQSKDAVVDYYACGPPNTYHQFSLAELLFWTMFWDIGPLDQGSTTVFIACVYYKRPMFSYN